MTYFTSVVHGFIYANCIDHQEGLKPTMTMEVYYLLYG